MFFARLPVYNKTASPPFVHTQGKSSVNPILQSFHLKYYSLLLTLFTETGSFILLMYFLPSGGASWQQIILPVAAAAGLLLSTAVGSSGHFATKHSIK